MNFADRLKLLREQKGLTQEDLAKRLNTSRSALSLWEIGKREPNHETLKRLADFFGVTVDYLLGNDRLELADILGNEQITLTEGGEILSFEKRKKLIQAIKYPDKLTRTLPILGCIKAGTPILRDGHEYDGELEVPSDIVADWALRVRGDSMIGAGILEGDYAICRDTKYVQARSGDIVVACKPDVDYMEVTLKYYIVENGHPVLRAANPEYEDIDFNGEGYRIAGVMVGLFRYGAPHYRVYDEYLSAREYFLRGWDEVVKAAMENGFDPQLVKSLIQVNAGALKNLKRMAGEGVNPYKEER